MLGEAAVSPRGPLMRPDPRSSGPDAAGQPWGRYPWPPPPGGGGGVVAYAPLHAARAPAGYGGLGEPPALLGACPAIGGVSMYPSPDLVPVPVTAYQPLPVYALGNDVGLLQSYTAPQPGLQYPVDRTPERRRVPYRAGLERAWEIREAFEAVDVDGTGRVGYAEVKAAMRALGLPVGRSELSAALQGQACDEGGLIGFDEFEAILSRQFVERDPLEGMLNAFRLFDRDDRGRISFKDLKRIAHELGAHIPESELQAMIDEFDQNQDGEIGETEFIRIMQLTTLH